MSNPNPNPQLDELTALLQQSVDQLERVQLTLELGMLVTDPARFEGVKYQMKLQIGALHSLTDELNTKIETMKQEEKEAVNIKPLSILSILIVALMALFLVGGVSAQDVTQEPAIPVAVTVNGEPVEATLVAAPTLPAPVVDPAPAPVNEVPDRTIYVIGLILFLGYSLVKDFLSGKRETAIADRLAQAHSNPMMMDEARQKYIESSLPVQETIKLLQAFSGMVGSLNIPGIDPIADEAKNILDDVISPGDGQDSQVNLHYELTKPLTPDEVAAIRTAAQPVESGST